MSGHRILVYLLCTIFLSVLLIFSFMSKDLLGFYIFFELSLIPLFFLVLGWGYQPERLQAAFYLFIYTLVGSLPFLGVLFYIFKTRSLCWAQINLIFFNFGPLFEALGIVSLAAIIIKLPLFGVHLWLPKAHVEAPVSGSIFLAAVILKLGFYGVYRLAFIFGGVLAMQTNIWVILLVWGAVVRGFVASRQSDIKALVAYSSIRHIGVIMGGLLIISCLSVKGAFVIVLAHAFCSSALFFLVNFLYERFSSRQVLAVRGHSRLFYGIRFWWFLFLIINFSAPPFLSLAGELLVMFGVTLTDIYVMAHLIVVRFIVAFFSVFLYRAISHGKISRHWSSHQSTDLFLAVLAAHSFPIVVIVLKTEVLWFYSLSLIKILQCGCIDTCHGGG